MAYDADPATVAWFESALRCDSARLRRRAVELLREVESEHRKAWLTAAANDLDPLVAATAVLVAASIKMAGDPPDEDLLESDFAAGVERDPLGWEWEYRVLVCRGAYLPSAAVLVWTRDDDDPEARRLAALKACVGEREPAQVTCILLSKRFVNRYTRSPRSFAEAMAWRASGRPRFHGP